MIRTAAAVSVAVALLSASAHAQSTRPVSLGIGAGVSVPMADLADEANAGFNVLGTIGWNRADLPIGLRGDVLFQQFSGKEEGSFRKIGGLANATVGRAMGTARGYVIGGVGMINLSTPEEEHGDHVHEGESKTNFAWNAGAGIEFRMGERALFLEARYVDAGDKHGAIPITLGFRF